MVSLLTKAVLECHLDMEIYVNKRLKGIIRYDEKSGRPVISRNNSQPRYLRDGDQMIFEGDKTEYIVGN